MSYGVESIRIHKKLRLDKRAGSDNWYARLTLPQLLVYSDRFYAVAHVQNPISICFYGLT